MIDYLHEFMTRMGLQWRIAGVPTAPTKDDLQMVLDRAKEILYDEPIPSQLEVPGLLVRRTDTDTFTVYLKLGETS